MSSYGPPPGPSPGHPQEPWRERKPDEHSAEVYAEPSDPWGGQGLWNAPASPAPDQERWAALGSQSAVPPGYPAGDPNSTWPPFATQPPKRSGGKTGLMLTLGALAVLLGVGGGTALYLAGQNGGTTPLADPTATPSTPVNDDRASPSVGPDATTTTPPATSTDVRFVQEGQCVSKEGTEEKPKLLVTPCGPRTYEVLVRIDGSVSGESEAKTKCAKVKGYTHFYFFDSPLDTLGYVLCLKAR